MQTSISKDTLDRAGERNRLLDLVGDTPLVNVNKVADGVSDDVRVCAKAEWFNLSGSIKARPALAMILGAEESGELTPGQEIIDASSGNTAVAYATLGAAMDYPVTICIPENATKERKAILAGLGAELVFTDPAEEMDGAIRKARELVDEHPDRYFYPDQYNNNLNWQSHYHTTGPEIIQNTEGNVTHFVAGLGTTGTFVGTSRYLKEQDDSINVISVQPETALHGLEGWKHLESSMVPGIYDPDVADRELRASTGNAYDMMRRLAEEEGLFVGPSAGAAVCAAVDVARELNEGTVVTILPDGGEKYMELWNDED